MKAKVWKKYAIWLFSIAVIVLLVANLIGYPHYQKALLKEAKQKLYQECLLITEEYMQNYENGELTKEAYLKQLHSVEVMISAEIWLANAKGVLITTASGVEDPIDIGKACPTLLDERFEENAEIEGLTTEPVLLAVEPYADGIHVKGYVIISQPMRQITDVVHHTMFIINMLLAGVIVLLTFVFIGFAIYHTKNLMILNRAAAAYTDGDFEHEITVASHDEYRDLSNSIHLLAEQHANLVEYQKNFIANISHDFRSPLTSIKGYAEAMKDGTIPYEMQGKYLDIILFETDRLSNLTNDLLDLSNFENKGVRLIYSDFSIAKMLRQSVMTFEGKCSQKNLKIRLVFPENDILVHADKGRIQQVVHNLLDNAIKFSNLNSTIVLTVVDRQEKILVSVKDSGIGIPKDCIQKVWERFYKTDLSRGKDKRGTGLGLSITKQIISAHNESIKVISTEGVGTEFVFSLAKA